MCTIDLTKIPQVKLSYQSHVKASDRPLISCSQDAHKVFLHFWDKSALEHIECAKLLMLNRANCALGIANLSMGGTAGTVMDVKVILQYAIKSHCSGFILCHNHPSGNLQPSNQDIDITGKIKKAAKLVDLSLLDHLIITSYGYTSLSDEGHI